MASQGATIEHGSLVRQWKWPIRMVFWWLMITGCVAIYAVSVQYWWAWKRSPDRMSVAAGAVLVNEERVLRTLQPVLFDPIDVADAVYNAVYGNVVQASVGIARAVMNWPAAFRARNAGGVPADEGQRFVQSQLAGLEDGLLMASTATRIWAVRTAMFASAAPLVGLLMFIGLVDGLAMRARRKACAGNESASLYHRAKLGQSFSAILAYLVCLGLPVFDHPTHVLLPLAVLLGALIRTQCLYYKKYL